jgi:hypothetical protein
MPPKIITNLHEKSQLKSHEFAIFNTEDGGRVSIPPDQIARLWNEEQARNNRPVVQHDCAAGAMKAVDSERERVIALCLAQYAYWRDVEEGDTGTLQHISMGAMGAASNILAGVMGLEGVA